MLPSLSTLPGWTSVVLSLSVLPFAVAGPVASRREEYRIVHRKDLPANSQVYQENKYELVYHNTDELLYLPHLPDTPLDKRDVESENYTRESNLFEWLLKRILKQIGKGSKGSKGSDGNDNAPMHTPSLPAPEDHVTVAVQSTKILGNSPSKPVRKFLDVPSEPLPHLPDALYAPEIINKLTEAVQYSAIFNGSGSLKYDSETAPHLKDLTTKPLMSRDSGVGAKINGSNLFIFADTETHTESGVWTGFVSNSVASNSGNQVNSSDAPVLHDKMGEWANSVGTMRSFVPLTIGEAAFNAKQAGHGQRYGVWPLAAPINIDENTALMYSGIIFSNIHHKPSEGLVQNAGTTLCKITVPGRGGAVAERIAPLLFTQGIQWGAAGGIFGNGRVYVIGKSQPGLMLGRVAVEDAADPNAYEFWHSDGTWSKDRPGTGSTDQFLKQVTSTVDIFYSPRHQTFVQIFMTPYADNNFYWRYLQSPPIKEDDPDFVENITKYPWSTPELLFHAPKPTPGARFAYAGGLHRGYYGDEDVTVGGTKALLSWTQPNGHSVSSPQTAYDHMTAEVTFA